MRADGLYSPAQAFLSTFFLLCLQTFLWFHGTGIISHVVLALGVWVRNAKEGRVLITEDHHNPQLISIL